MAFRRFFSTRSAPVFSTAVHSSFAQDVTTTAGMFFIVSSSYAFGTLLGEMVFGETSFETGVTTKMGSIETKMGSIETTLGSIETTTTAIYTTLSDLAKAKKVDKKSD